MSDWNIYWKKKSESSGLGLGQNVVIELSETLQNKEYQIFADNFFSSVPLAKKMLDKGIAYWGTILPNRKNVPEFLNDI